MHLNFHHAIYHFLSHKMIILSRNCPFVVVLRLNEKGDPVFICVFYLLWLHKKYILRRKNLDSRNGFFFFCL